MAYQALYRRYRPQFFEDFVGQEAVIRTLRSQVENGRIAHAYLFCGTRGTGKTSAAKVFARAINCETPQDGDPCGVCPTCKRLAEENALDILEIDAASNNGVDEIRDLREQVKYPPAVGRYRVYIIDEVHMLSTGAFNALLKTLEEPPAHAKFILATTEPQRIPATILSRCQRFDFGRIPAQLIEKRVESALDLDGVPYEKQAVARIARAAEGGMRDAWSITDMCLGYAGETADGLTDTLVREILGASDRETIFSFVEKMLDGDTAAIMQQIDDVMRRGREVQVFLKDITGHLRALLLASVSNADQVSAVLEVTTEDAAAYVEQAGKTSSARLMRLMNLFLKAESDTRWSPQPRYVLETAALRACLPEEEVQVEALVERVAELERRIREGVVVKSGAPSGAPKAGAPEAKKEAPAASTSPKPQNTEEDPNLTDEMKDIWKKALKKLREEEPSRGNIFVNGRLVSARDGQFIEVFNKQVGAIYVNMLNSAGYKQPMEKALSEVAGYPCTFRAAVEGTVQETNASILAAKAEDERRKEKNLNRIFDTFGRENVVVDKE